MTTLFCKIPPNLPFPKGGIIPLFSALGSPRRLAEESGFAEVKAKRERGDLINETSKHFLLQIQKTQGLKDLRDQNS